MNKKSLLPTTLLMLLVMMGTVVLNCPNALAKKKKVCGPKIENDAVEVIPLNDTGYSIVSR